MVAEAPTDDSEVDEQEVDLMEPMVRAVAMSVVSWV